MPVYLLATQEIRSHSLEPLLDSTVLVKMSQLAFRKYARFGGSDKDLRDGVKTEEEEGFEGR